MVTRREKLKMTQFDILGQTILSTGALLLDFSTPISKRRTEKLLCLWSSSAKERDTNLKTDLHQSLSLTSPNPDELNSNTEKSMNLRSADKIIRPNGVKKSVFVSTLNFIA